MLAKNIIFLKNYRRSNDKIGHSSRSSSIQQSKTKISFSFLNYRQTEKTEKQKRQTDRQKRQTDRKDRQTEKTDRQKSQTDREDR